MGCFGLRAVGIAGAKARIAMTPEDICNPWVLTCYSYSRALNPSKHSWNPKALNPESLLGLSKAPKP